jgi:hypothetical protein
VAGSRNVGAYRRRRLVYIGASTGTGGMFRRKRSPEEEKSKLVIRRKNMSEII